MTNSLLAVILPMVDEPYVKNVENTLEALQAEVGGFIETVQITTDLLAIVNEEGLLMGLNENRWLPGIVGRRVIISSKVTGDGEFTGIPGHKISTVLKLFKGGE